MNTTDNLSIFDRLEGYTLALIAVMFPVMTTMAFLS